MKSNGFPYLTDTLKEGCETWPECGCPIDRCDADDVMARPLMVVVLTMAVWALLLLALVVFAMGVIGMVKAYAHDALPTAAKPLGWKYPYLCCSDMDCRQVQSKVRETPQGFVVPSGEVIAMTDPRIKDSPDGEYHWCTVAGEETSRTICLFVPPRGF